MDKEKLLVNLGKAHARKRELGGETIDMLLDILSSANEPLVVGEISVALAERGRGLDYSYTGQLLSKLANAGKISVRIETPNERDVRVANRSIGSQNRGAHFPVKYYSTLANAKKKRKTAQALNTLADGSHRKNNKKKTTRPAKAVRVQTGTLSTRSLLQRVSQLEAELATLRKIVG